MPQRAASITNDSEAGRSEVLQEDLNQTTLSEAGANAVVSGQNRGDISQDSARVLHDGECTRLVIKQANQELNRVLRVTNRRLQ